MIKMAGRRVSAAMVVGGLGLSTIAHAAEGGISFWVPGQAVPQAAVLPPPGVYFDTTGYFYDASFPAGRQTRLGGNIVADVKVDLKADFVTGLWVTPWHVFGGDMAFAVVVPWGDPTIRAGVLINGPLVNRLLGGPLARSVQDAGLTVGDPILSSSIGWHAGNLSWKVASALNVPAGAYKPGQLSNLAPNRVIDDVSAAATWLAPKLGLDLSAATGFTFNGKNYATHYRTGTEFHLDVSATKFLTKDLSIGALASHYEQITDDSGSGATLGPFRGRDMAIGGTIGYSFKIGDTPVAMRAKMLQEVETKNRFKGTISLLEVSFPLGGAVVRSAALKKPVPGNTELAP